MAESITLAPVTTFTNDSSAVATVNANYQLIASAFNNVLDRFGTAPNTMQAVLDMNSFNIINLPGPATVNSPVRLVDVINPSVALTVPPTGTSGSTVPFLNGTNTWSGSQNFTGATTTVATQALTDITTKSASTAFVQNLLKTVIVDIATYGGVGDGSTDNTTAFTAALAAVGTSGGVIYFGPGTYRFNSPFTIAMSAGIKRITLAGAGIDCTTLNWPASNALVITYGSVGCSFEMKDLTMTTGGVGLYTAVNMSFVGTEETFSGAFEAPTVFQNVMFRGSDGYPTTIALTLGWGTCVTATAISNIFWKNCTFQGPNGISTYSTTGTGVIVQGDFTNSNFGVVYNFTDCTFNSLNRGFQFGTWIQGVFFENCNFTLGSIGIICPQDPHSSGLEQLAVSNCQFNCTNGIFIDATLDAGLINNSLFIAPPGGSCIKSGSNGIPNIWQVTNNTFSGPGSALPNTVLVSIGNATAWIINNNNFVNCTGASTFGIAISSGCSLSRFEHNVFQFVATPISNSSTSIVVQNNTGYNPVGFAAVSPGASPWTYITGSTPEVHYMSGATNISALTVGGSSVLSTTVAANTQITVNLPALSTMVVTYSGTLTDKRYVL